MSKKTCVNMKTGALGRIGIGKSIASQTKEALSYVQVYTFCSAYLLRGSLALVQRTDSLSGLAQPRASDKLTPESLRDCG